MIFLKHYKWRSCQGLYYIKLAFEGFKTLQLLQLLNTCKNSTMLHIEETSFTSTILCLCHHYLYLFDFLQTKQPLLTTEVKYTKPFKSTSIISSIITVSINMPQCYVILINFCSSMVFKYISSYRFNNFIGL